MFTFPKTFAGPRKLGPAASHIINTLISNNGRNSGRGYGIPDAVLVFNSKNKEVGLLVFCGQRARLAGRSWTHRKV
jgi:hypothetical protein